MSEATRRRRAAWAWVPSLYFAEGIPYVVVMTVAVILYKRLGVSNREIALFTSLLYLPWVIKPLWSPVVDVVRTKRWWIVVMQLLIGAGLAGVALSLPMDAFLRYSLAFFWLLAFSSATHDIAADGFYMLGLTSHEQAWFVGVRSTFYRIAMIVGQGLLVMFAGVIESNTGLPDALVTVRSDADASAVTQIDVSSAARGIDDGPGRVSFASRVVRISPAPQSASEVEAIIEQARAWNTERGFYRAETPEEQETAQQNAGWRLALEGWVRRWFGEAERAAETGGGEGPVTVVVMSYGAEVTEGRDIVVQFERSGGSSDLQVVEGQRFAITRDNYEAPFASVIQLDPRAEGAVEAEFRARSGDFVLAWTSTFYLLAGLFLMVALYHAFALPRPDDPSGDVPDARGLVASFAEALLSFLRKKHIVVAIAFLLLYRFAEAQLAKMAAPFLLEGRAGGGLGLSTGQVGFLYGTIGVLMLTAGGLLGGFLAARNGLKYWLWWMVAAINLPNAAYVALAYAQPESTLPVAVAIALEQFGYGFGFAAYMLYMLYLSRGSHETAHYAICTGFMSLGMMIPGMFSGWLQELIGYRHFFVWVLIATIPGFLVTYLIPLDPDFGKKGDE